MASVPVRVRFAPSPTGYLHVGGARTALFNWLFARRHHGVFILRIEDTDRTRYQEDALEDLMAMLRWLGLDWDEGPDVGGPYGPYFQSQRLHIYQEYAEKLVREGHAYYCYCSPERLEAMREEQRRRGEPPGYDRHCRYLTAKRRAEYEAQGIKPVIRLAVPLEGQTSFTDVIRGTITVDNSSLDDLVLLKSDGYPTYHLANVIDDHLMRISHIMRADEWLPSVPKHVLLYQAFGWEPPAFAHLPVILDPSGQGKMSKRRQRVGDKEHYVLVREFKEAGYLPEAMFNFLTLVGWSLDDKTQIMSKELAIQHFDLDRINKAPAAFSYEKLEWMNGYYIRQLPPDELAERLVPFLARGLDMSEEEIRRRPETRLLAPLVQERIKLLSEAVEMIDFAYREQLDYPAEQLIGEKMSAEASLEALKRARQVTAELETFDAPAVEAALRPLVDELGVKARQLFGIIRIAITGKPVSPPLFESMAILGKERCLRRLDAAIERLGRLAGPTPSS
ncbi:MAG: glutamate--tRNA ligase [Anaerolineae bacterium]